MLADHFIAGLISSKGERKVSEWTNVKKFDAIT